MIFLEKGEDNPGDRARLGSGSCVTFLRLEGYSGSWKKPIRGGAWPKGGARRQGWYREIEM